MSIALIAGVVQLPGVALANAHTFEIVQVNPCYYTGINYRNSLQNYIQVFCDGQEISYDTETGYIFTEAATNADITSVGAYDISIFDKGSAESITFVQAFRIEPATNYGIIYPDSTTDIRTFLKGVDHVPEIIGNKVTVRIIGTDGTTTQDLYESTAGSEGYEIDFDEAADISGMGPSAGHLKIVVQTTNISRKEKTVDFDVAYPMGIDNFVLGNSNITGENGVYTADFTGECVFNEGSTKTGMDFYSSTLDASGNPLRVGSVFSSTLDGKFNISVRYNPDFVNVSSESATTLDVPNGIDGIINAGTYFINITNATTNYVIFRVGGNFEYYCGDVQLRLTVGKNDLSDCYTIKTADTGEVAKSKASGEEAVQSMIPTVEVEDYHANGNKFTNYEVYYGNRPTPLVEGVDYNVLSASGGSVLISGIGNYRGEVSFLYKMLSDISIEYEHDTTQVYNPKLYALTYDYAVKDETGSVIPAENYTVEYWYDTNRGFRQFDTSNTDYTSEEFKAMTSLTGTFTVAGEELTVNGAKKLRIVGTVGNFEGQYAELAYTITPRDITMGGDPAIFDISAGVAYSVSTNPINKITYAGVELVKDVDYTDDSANNTEVGIYTLHINGIGNYTGTYLRDYEVTALDIADTSCTPELVYKGVNIYPTVYVGEDVTNWLYRGEDGAASGTLRNDTYSLVNSWYMDDTIISGNFVLVNTATNKVVGLWDGRSVTEPGQVVRFGLVGNEGSSYSGSKYYDFTVAKGLLTEDDISLQLSSVEWTGTTSTGKNGTLPGEVTVRNAGGLLREDSDYVLTYVNNGEPGEAKVLVSVNHSGSIGKNYANTDPLEMTYTITQRDIAHCADRVEISVSYTDNGDGTYTWTPTVKVSDYITGYGVKVLTEGTDYILSNAGPHVTSGLKDAELVTVDIIGAGKYTGSFSRDYKCGYDISKAVVTGWNADGLIYDGTPKPLNENTAIKVVLEDEITGEDRRLSSDTDYAITIKRTDTRVDESGNKYSRDDRIHAGTFEITIKGKGIYFGETEPITYTIAPMNVYAENVSVSFPQKGTDEWDELRTFTGQEITPRVTVSLRDDNGNVITRPDGSALIPGYDYFLEWFNNVHATRGTTEENNAYVQVKGDGDAKSAGGVYEADYKIVDRRMGNNSRGYFAILPRPLSAAEIKLKYDSYIYSGAKIIPEIESATYGGADGYDLTARREYAIDTSNEFISDSINTGTWDNVAAGGRIFVESLSDEAIVTGQEAFDNGKLINCRTVVDADGNETYAGGGGSLVVAASTSGNFTGYVVIYFNIYPADLADSGSEVSLEPVSLKTKIYTTDRTVNIPKTFHLRYSHPEGEKDSSYRYASSGVLMEEDDYVVIDGADDKTARITGVGAQTFKIKGEKNFRNEYHKNTGTDALSFNVYANIADPEAVSVQLNPLYFTDGRVSVNAFRDMIAESGFDERDLVILRDLVNNREIENENFNVSLSGYNIGETVITITGVESNFYTGKTTTSFNITGSIQDAEVKVEDAIYTGKPIENLTLYVENESVSAKTTGGRTVLKEGVDYEIVAGSFEKNIDPGINTASVKIRGLGDYADKYDTKKTVNFTILYPLADVTLEFRYDVYDKWLVCDDLTGLVSTGEYTVNGKVIKSEDLTAFNVEYNTQEIVPVVTAYYNFRNQDGSFARAQRIDTSYYEVAVVNNRDAGTAAVTVTPKDAAAGKWYDITAKNKLEWRFTIDRRPIRAEWFPLSYSSHQFTNGKLTPSVVTADAKDSDYAVDLVDGMDYQLTGYSDNVTGRSIDDTVARYGFANIRGLKNYTGAVAVPFEITNVSIDDPDVELSFIISDESGNMEIGYNAAGVDTAGGMRLVYAYTGADIGTEVAATNTEIKNGTGYYIYSYEDITENRTAKDKFSGSPGNPDTGANAEAPTKQGTYRVTIRGIGNYDGIRTFVMKVIPKNITPDDVDDGEKTGDIYITILDQATGHYVESKDAVFNYTGYEIRPAENQLKLIDPDTGRIGSGIKVYQRGNEMPLTEDVDYEVYYDPTKAYIDVNYCNTGVKENWPRVLVRGIGNFTGETLCYFSIAERDIASSGITYDYTYDSGAAKTDGSNHMDYKGEDTAARPVIKVTDSYKVGSPRVLKEGVDYEVVYSSQFDDGACVYGGQASFTIKGTGNYKGEVADDGRLRTYNIGIDISEATTRLLVGNSSVYDGLYVDLSKSNVIVTNKEQLKINDDQYTILAYKDPVLTDGKVDLTQSKPMDISEIVDVGVYYMVVDGVPSEGTYAAAPSTSPDAIYRVTPKDIFHAKISGYPETVYYTGDYIKIRAVTVVDPEMRVSRTSGQYRTVQLREGTDYYIDETTLYVNPGKGIITIKGMGNYTGEAHAYYTIEANSIAGGETGDGTSSGTGITANGVTIDANDITIYYDGNGDYMTWTGKAIVPLISINYNNRALVEGTEYAVSATNNINAGLGTLVITGKGGFHGTISKRFKIKADLNTATISSIPDQSYTGQELTPSFTVKCGGNVLSNGSDYTAQYINNINVGRATIDLSAVNDSYYYGTKSAHFNISNGASGMSVSGYASTYVYTGYAISPELHVTMDGKTLTAGVDYTVTYADNINVGIAKATVTGVGKYSGTKTINYEIVAKNISTVNAYVAGGNSYAYTGSGQTPSVTLRDTVTGNTLTNGTDYSISYSNNTDPGMATVSIKALSNNYTGTKTVTFAISSAAVDGLAVSKVTANSMRLDWDDQSYADGYQICDQNNKVMATADDNFYKVGGLTSYKTYKFKVRSFVENDDGTVSYGDFSKVVSKRTKLAAPKVTLKAAGNGKVKLTWTKSRAAGGYEIYYSTKKNGVYTKLKTKSASSTRAYNDTGLAAGEKYYYTVRAYRTVNGSKVYSNYSSIKAVTVK